MPQISEHLLEELSEFVRSKIGIFFPPTRFNELRTKITELVKTTNYTSSEEFIAHLMSDTLNRKQVGILASKLTVGETYFFRDTETLKVLQHKIIPEIIKKKSTNGKTLRIWSAGCSTGEEPYTIAMLLKQTIPDFNNWNIILLATDINTEFLKKATRGLYGDWSFRGVDQATRNLYFQKVDTGQYQINSNVKRVVEFSNLNLIEDSYPSVVSKTNGMDLIFCRNVLMYFSHQDIIKTSEKLYNCLVDGGWLVTSPSESYHYLSKKYSPVFIDGVTFYKKGAFTGKAKKIRKQKFITKAIDSNLSREEYETIKVGKGIRRKLSTTPKVVKKIATVNDRSKVNGYNINDALASYQNGNYSETESILAKTDNNQQAKLESVLLLARLRANQGKFNDALQLTEEALSIDQLDAGIHYLMANIHEEQGHIEKAYKALTIALYLQPDFALTHFNLGNIARKLNKNKESKKYYQNTIDLLQGFQKNDSLPYSDGLTAGRLSEIAKSLIEYNI